MQLAKKNNLRRFGSKANRSLKYLIMILRLWLESYCQKFRNSMKARKEKDFSLIGKQKERMRTDQSKKAETSKSDASAFSLLPKIFKENDKSEPVPDWEDMVRIIIVWSK